MPRILLVLPTMLAAAPALAQQTDEQLWLQTNGSITLNARDKVTLEAIVRFGDAAQGVSNRQLGVQFSRKLKNGAELTFGYRHSIDSSQGATLADEERFRQIIFVPIGSRLNGQLRVEQRIHSDGGEIGFRVRPRIGVGLPLGSGGLKLFATQEHFINLNTTNWGQRGGYERMRNAVGISIPLGGKVRAEVGYLNQYRFGRAGKRDQMDHAFTLTLNFNVASLGNGD